MLHVMYTFIAVGIVIAAFALWIKVSIWIMGLGINDDGEICWPWKKDD